MRATVVVDNRKSDALPGEWGLCIYIEYGERKLLLDTGASELFAENAEKLGLDLSAVDAAVLSHAHYDHGNGMEAFFRRNDHAPFYVGPTCAADCYAGRWLFRRYIGIPPTVLSDYSRRIRYVREKTGIFPGVTLLPHSTPGLQQAGRREHMFRRVGGRWQPDDFSHEQSLVLETEQRDTAKRLLQRNNYSRMDYLGLEQKIIQTQGEIDMLAAAIPKTQAMMDEARQRIGSRVAEEQLAISQEINKRRTELGSVRESLTAGGDRVTRTEVRSPVRGSVKQILVNTVGGVVKPGEAIMDIVPMDESLLVEVRVRPQDVAFLRPGQDVMIKVSAYDFSIYGGLPGKLESISADTIEDKKGDFYYLVKVRTGETAIRRNDEILPIIPGMIVVADIIIGKKTVLDYILKPVMKARQNALTER